MVDYMKIRDKIALELSQSENKTTKPTGNIFNTIYRRAPGGAGVTCPAGQGISACSKPLAMRTPSPAAAPLHWDLTSLWHLGSMNRQPLSPKRGVT